MAKSGEKTEELKTRPMRSQNSPAVSSVYVEGNTVRKVTAEPKETIRLVHSTRRKAVRMNFRYVIFLTLAAVLTVCVCINYLRLQAQYVSDQKTVTALSSELSSLKLENDSVYNRIVSSVDLEALKKTAMEEYGMVYASDRQIRTYDGSEHDYVRQYQEIPAE